jgi:hypothetical protein
MSTIYLDPAAMDATAGAIGEHAREVDSAIADLETTCTAAVPPSLAGWLAEELRDITVNTRLAELLYVVAALDTARRAQQLQADQSLATTWPHLADPLAGQVTTTYDLGAVLAGATVVGGTGPSFTNDFPVSGPAIVGGNYLGATPAPGVGVSMPGLSTDSFAAQNPFMGAAILGPGLSGFGAGPWDFAGAVANHSIANSLAPAGLDVVSPGVYVDETGRTGKINQTYRNPRTGRLEF